MIEPVYFDTCLCFYFDKILTAQKIQNRGKYRKFSFSLLSDGGAPINPNELKVPKIPKENRRARPRWLYRKLGGISNRAVLSRINFISCMTRSINIITTTAGNHHFPRGLSIIRRVNEFSRAKRLRFINLG